jgi:hypothetical protein
MGRDANDILQEGGPGAIDELLAKAKPYKGKGRSSGHHGAPPPVATKMNAANSTQVSMRRGEVSPTQPVTVPLEIYGKLSAVIPPRNWLLGTTWCRKFPSGLFAPGGVGKTSMRIAQAIAVTTMKPITGEFVHRRCKLLYISLEDDIEELMRRIRACLLHHNLEYPEGWLYFCAPGRRSGKLVSKELMKADLVHYMESAVIEHGIDVIVIDPLVKAHGVEENSNTDMDAVLAIIADLSIAADIVVDFLHHTSKGTMEAGNVDKARGASAIKDGGRLMKSLTVMSPEEAKVFGITNEEDRKSLVRYDNGKVNIVKAERAKWFKLVDVELGNGNEDYPSGDRVQAIEVWEPPDAFEGLTNFTCNTILNEIEAHWDAGTPRSAENTGQNQAWMVVAKTANKDEASAKRIIRKWLETGVLLKDTYKDEKQRKDRLGVRVDNSKRPS